MLPPCMLFLSYPVLFLLCFPLGKLSLPFLALKKRLYLRERDTGRDLRFMAGYGHTIRFRCMPLEAQK